MENNTATITIDNRFAIIPHWVIQSGVPATAIHLYTVLAIYADGRTGEAFPSRTTLAKQIGASTKTVDRAIKALQGVGAQVVQMRLGHESLQTTSKTYAHLLLEAQLSATAVFSQVAGSRNQIES